MTRLEEMMDLSGRAALVTGGAGHIGLVLAMTLAGAGAEVVITDLDQKACQDAVLSLAARGGAPVKGLACDLSQEDETRALPVRAAELLGGLDILINCAGFTGATEYPGWAAPFFDQTAAAWRSALEVNLTAPFVLSQAAAPLLAARGRGSIINIGSIYGELGPNLSLYRGTAMANPAAYGASKAGLWGLTRHMATVLAPEIRVNLITLGGVQRGQPEVFVRRYEKRTPLGRMTREEDVAGAVLFLAGDMSSYVTGADLKVDGGFSAW